MWVLRRLFTAAALVLPWLIIYRGLSAVFGIHADPESDVAGERLASAIFSFLALGGTALFWRGVEGSSKRVDAFLKRWLVSD